ncbi:DUF1906 domain-containing protein [Spirillospora sp. NPDC047279]|uniref:DUF1906 domain-containing protein n=1 Tax=Spirillospora sp. NPDC047279 TaxID=3155478 RepID=UPI0033C47AA8
MRHAAVLGGTFGAAVLAPLVAGLEPASARPAAVQAAALNAGVHGGQARTAGYRGARIPVPAGWEVHRLDLDPSRCVRHDRPAIYLGRPGAEQDCPARLIGGAETLHVEPLDGVSAQRRGGAVRANRLARFAVRESFARRVSVRVPEAGVSITGVYGGDARALQDVIRSVRLTAAWAAGGSPSAERRGGTARKEPRIARPTAREKGWAAGRGFDTCTAPSSRTMAAWRRSYAIANIYIGGASRGCSQPNLTRFWVKAVRRMGYRLIPTYVGLQAPCNQDAYRAHFKAKDAAAEGRRAAADAVARARALGIPRKRPIYFDMEAYPSAKTKCRQAVLTFLHSWSRAITARKYVSGVYSSAGSGIRDLGWATGIAKPKSVWFAHWDNKASAYGSPFLMDHWWHPHRRIKQYRGPHKEEHGGISLNIDSNVVDGRVY